MKTAASISPGRGRGIAPFPGPHPQKQNLAVYTKVLTHPRALMEKLPLGQAGLMKHEFIELGPLTPLHLLLSDGGSTAGK
jgi:hypothetical protein